ncbi:MAG: O-acetyl-ADP-ribose deacetylase [Cyclobacteriaceae bacterium]|nr:O-acetyl-ADP-ribose deacetylase [Cyclobacteriaceae bacterium]
MDRIYVIQGDITKLNAEAIVNAANKELLPGGGVCGAIHRAAGPQLAQECSRIGYCPAGKAVITSGAKLKAAYVIHAVGPVWQGGNQSEKELLASTYRESLRLAVSKGIKTIAFPNISTGIYGFPKELAAGIAINEVKSFIDKNNSIQQVIFCCFDSDNYELYRKLLNE